MKKQPSKSEMKRRESRETPADEKRESAAYQRREEKLGVEKHKPRKGGY